MPEATQLQGAWWITGEMVFNVHVISDSFSAVKEGTRSCLCLLFLLVRFVFVFVPMERFWILEPETGPQRPLFEWDSAFAQWGSCWRKIPIRAADRPGVLQAQPGSGNCCQALAETCCQVSALSILRGHLISNRGQCQVSAETPAKHGDSQLGLCLSHIPMYVCSAFQVHMALQRALAGLWICAEPQSGLWAHLQKNG